MVSDWDEMAPEDEDEPLKNEVRLDVEEVVLEEMEEGASERKDKKIPRDEHARANIHVAAYRRLLTLIRKLRARRKVSIHYRELIGKLWLFLNQELLFVVLD